VVTAAPHNRPVRALSLRFSAGLALLVVLLGWIVASPLGSSPDDDYHLASIWCSELSYLHPCAEFPGEQGGASLLVPAVVIESHICYAFQPDATADCVANVSDTLRLTDRINQVQGLYPSGYYTVMSLFASPDYETAVFAMRVVNSLMVVALLLAFFMIGRPFLQQSALLVLPVLFIPLAAFLFASTNPSSWTITGSVFFFLFGSNALAWESSSRRRIASLILAILSAVLAVSSRIDASAFIFLLALVIIVLAGRECVLRSKVASGLILGTGVAALMFFILQGLGPAGSPEKIGESEYVGGLLVTNVLEVPGFLGGVVGGAPLAWLDTRLPGLVSTVGLLAVGALAFWGLAVMGRRKTVATVTLFVAAFGIPVALAQQQRIEVLDFVQARYLLPLVMVLLLVVVMTVPPRTRENFPFAPHATLTVLVAVSGVVALWATYHRFAYGADIPYLARNVPARWFGLVEPISITVILIALVASAAFAFLMMASYRVSSAQINTPATNREGSS
jgi:hypothetical protein